MYSIRMYSKADMTKGHGVLSAHDEQVALVKNYLKDSFRVYEKGNAPCALNHFHTINPEFLLYALIGKLKHRQNVGYVHFLPETLENSISLPKPIKWLFYKYVLFFYRRMDALVTVNPYFIDVLKKYGVSPKKVTYIPNLVSKKSFYPMSTEEKMAARKSFSLPLDKKIILCAGQLQRRKGVLDFVEMAKKMPEHQFVWAGDFSFGKISKDYELIKKVVENPPENVTFLGLIDHSKMNQLYNACDIMLLPSYEELFPMTVLEAMSCQIPVLVRYLDIYDNILFDFVLYGHSKKEFMTTINRLCSDEDFYNKCCEASAKGSQCYNEPSIAAAWRKYYTSIITHRHLPSVFSVR